MLAVLGPLLPALSAPRPGGAACPQGALPLVWTRRGLPAGKLRGVGTFNVHFTASFVMSSQCPL